MIVPIELVIGADETTAARPDAGEVLAARPGEAPLH
jgi:hypothetical protein